MRRVRLSIILFFCALITPALAQTDDQRPNASENLLSRDPSGPETPVPGVEPAIPDTAASPQDKIRAYEQQMALVTVQTCVELAKISDAVRNGQISREKAEYLTRHGYELGLIRFQFLDTMHDIAESGVAKEDTSQGKEDGNASLQTFNDTVIVTPPDSGPDVPAAVAKYLELTPLQIANIQSRIAEQRRQVQPLLKKLSENENALENVVRGNEDSDQAIRKLAAEQSRIIEKLTVANSRLQREIYQILTAEQRAKLASAGDDALNPGKPVIAHR